MRVPWPTVILSDVANRITVGIATSTTEHYRDAGVPLIRNLNIHEGRLDTQDLLFITNDFDQKNSSKRLRQGDVITVRTGFAGISCVVPNEFENAQTFTTLITTPNALRLNPRFLCQHLNSVLGAREFVRLTGDAGRANLNAGALREYTLDLPPLPEQQEIADILGTWDNALEKLDALIAAKVRCKQALMQQLLTGQRRPSGFSKPWARVELSDVAEECSIRNGQKLDRTRLYAVTKAEGMVPMRENVQGATINRCLIVERGWFAYNPMRINIGSIARWEDDAPVMVSPDYVVFRTKESLLLSDYLNHVRHAALWSDFVGAAGNGSVRIRIWFDDLGYFEFPLPPIEEQRAIAAILDTADAELRLLRQQRAALDQQKRGLMQHLLTGKVRVKS